MSVSLPLQFIVTIAVITVTSGLDTNEANESFPIVLIP